MSLMADPRERLMTYAGNRNGNAATERWDAMVGFAAHHVNERFEYLSLALIDYYVASRSLLIATHQETPVEKGDAEVERHIEERHRLLRLTHYRIDVFFFVARMFLDDVAAFIDRALAPNSVQCGKHSESRDR